MFMSIGIAFAIRFRCTLCKPSALIGLNQHGANVLRDVRLYRPALMNDRPKGNPEVLHNSIHNRFAAGFSIDTNISRKEMIFMD